MINKESDLYNVTVSALTEAIKARPENLDKFLKIATDFISKQGIGADPDKHRGLKELKDTIDLPFDEEDEEYITSLS